MSVLDNIKENITKQTINYSTTITDHMRSKFGIPLNSQMTENTELSELVSDVFLNTKVKVYIFNSNKAICISLPGAADSMDPQQLRLQAQLDDIAVTSASNSRIPSIGISPQWREIFSNTFSNKFKSGGEMRLEFDPKYKKLQCNIPKVTVFISSMLLNQLDNDKEVIAIILFEVARNTTLFWEFIRRWGVRLSVLASITTTSFLKFPKIFKDASTLDNLHRKQMLTPFKFGSTYNANEKIVENLQNSVLKQIGEYLMILGGIIVIGAVIAMYFSRRAQIKHDEFVIKCGYGEALRSAIEKYNKFIFANSISKDEATKELNFIDRISHWFTKFFAYIRNAFAMIGLSSKQSIGARNKMIEQKTNKYSVDNKNVDRTAPI